MVYKQKKSIFPTLLAVAVTSFGACAFVFGFGSTGPLSSSLAAIGASGDNLAVTNSTTGASQSPVVDSQEMNLLANIRQIESINLDSSVLNDSYFVSFTDFVRFTAQPAGRANPFAPFAGMAAATSSAHR
jgi:hypothetical protein